MISKQCSRCGVQTMDVVESEYAQVTDYRRRNCKEFIPKGDPLCSSCKASDKVFKSNSVNKGLREIGFW